MQQNHHHLSCSSEPSSPSLPWVAHGASPAANITSDSHHEFSHAVHQRLNKRTDAYVSIGSMPAEILAHIFAFLITRPAASWVAPECMLDELDAGLGNLVWASHVCRFWREVALTTSSLWSTFGVRNLPRDRICLERSRDCPLRVYMPSTNSPFFEELSAHFHRLKELHTEITLPTPTTAITYHLDALYHENRAPLLECLTVRNRVHSDIAGSNPLRCKFTGQFPELKRLHTVDLAISLTGQHVIKGLTHVRLEGSLVSDVRMDVHDLLDFLEVNDGVEELYLSGALFKQIADCNAVQSTRAVVPLASLRKLSLRQFSTSDEIAHLLSHLAIPPGVAMDLGCSDVNMQSGRLFFPQDMTALGNMQRLTRLRVGFTSRYAECISGEDERSSSSFSCEVLHRAYSKAHRADVLSAITNTLPLHDVQELWIGGPRSHWIIPEVPAATWRRFFAMMPNLTTLHLEQTKHHLQLVSALCLDAEQPDAAMSVPAPGLKHLHFTGDCGLALGDLTLRVLVEERASICGGLDEIIIATAQNGDKLRDLCSYLASYVGAVAICDKVDGAAVTSLFPSSQKGYRGRFISV